MAFLSSQLPIEPIPAPSGLHRYRWELQVRSICYQSDFILRVTRFSSVWKHLEFRNFTSRGFRCLFSPQSPRELREQLLCTDLGLYRFGFLLLLVSVFLLLGLHFSPSRSPIICKLGLLDLSSNSTVSSCLVSIFLLLLSGLNDIIDDLSDHDRSHNCKHSQISASNCKCIRLNWSLRTV